MFDVVPSGSGYEHHSHSNGITAEKTAERGIRERREDQYGNRILRVVGHYLVKPLFRRVKPYFTVGYLPAQLAQTGVDIETDAAFGHRFDSGE